MLVELTEAQVRALLVAEDCAEHWIGSAMQQGGALNEESFQQLSMQRSAASALRNSLAEPGPEPEQAPEPTQEDLPLESTRAKRRLQRTD